MLLQASSNELNAGEVCFAGFLASSFQLVLSVEQKVHLTLPVALCSGHRSLPCLPLYYRAPCRQWQGLVTVCNKSLSVASVEIRKAELCTVNQLDDTKLGGENETLTLHTLTVQVTLRCVSNDKL